MRRKIIIRAPAKEPKGLKESIKSLEKTAELLKTLKASGVTREQRKMLISDIVEIERTSRSVNESEYEIVKGMKEAAGLSEYDACHVLETILNVIMKTLAAREKVKLNRLGTFYLETRPRGQTVTFIPSPLLVQELAK